MAEHLKEIGVKADSIIFEHKFLDDRRFRFDIFIWQDRDWPSGNTGIEIDGGMWSGGHRHTKAIEIDYEKLNLAQAEGVKVYRFTNRQVETGEAIAFLKKVR